MKDKLKDFVSEHRDEFDVFEPRPDMWQSICQDLPATQSKKAKVIKFNFGDSASFSANVLFMRVAAAVVLLLGCGITLFLMKQNAPAASNTIAVASEQKVISNIAPEMVEVEAYYVNQIKEKKSQLSDYDLKLLGLDEQREVDQELAKLDSSYIQLKKQLYTTPNTDEIVEAMIQNLQIRIRVLNKQLEVLQSVKNLEKSINSEIKENETTDV
ncbi:hypothetical protein ACSX1A_19845 [Pontibacter sp. MBLB2868]|uniref:hypothetical protein n=1 Tax=Pontibacter sp. MBLB2868 TaxID=3451555 RepID=UPI003F754418